MLAFGEVQTGLLQNSVALSRRATEMLLADAADDRVRSVERPIARSVSPDRLEGVDCRLPTVSGRTTRGVGTVVARTVVVAGHVAQGSAHAVVSPARTTLRLPWSHYLASPGRLEAIGRLAPKDVELGVLSGVQPAGTLELSAIAARMVDTVQRSRLIDHAPPLRTPRARVRWTALLDPAIEDPGGTYTLISDEVRTIQLRVRTEDLAAVVALCEDLAMHDWLLTTVLSVLGTTLAHDRSRSERMNRLQPLLEHLPHLWMPGGHVIDELSSVWADLNRRPGFTRQWESAMARVRDLITIGALDLLQAADNRRISSPVR